MVRDMGTYVGKKLFGTLEIRFMCIGWVLLSSSVVDPHWFHCGSESVSIILGQCGFRFGSRDLIIENL
jgi:hypothetical protein